MFKKNEIKSAKWTPIPLYLQTPFPKIQDLPLTALMIKLHWAFSVPEAYLLAHIFQHPFLQKYTNRGSYMSAHVLLILLNELGKRDKMRGLPISFISFSQQV